MNIMVRSPTVPAGEGAPGDLLLDLPSRTLWGVVDPAVDSSGAVLLSDIQALAGQLAQATADANDYTDARLASYALLASPIFTGDPRAPTPVTSDNDTSIATTAFVKAAIAAAQPVIPAGMIAMYAGSLADIGINTPGGPQLAGWHLCDGASGTPDLRDKFILAAGAGSTIPGNTNPAGSLITTDDGQHFHTSVTGYYTLTLNDIPSHAHASGNLTGYTSTAGAHTHPTVGTDKDSSRTPASTAAGSAATKGSDVIPSDGAHTHTVFVNGGATGYSGSSGAHRHSISLDGQHHHTITSSQLRATLPYYALAYIMKL
jgi:hypothetical protein